MQTIISSEDSSNIDVILMDLGSLFSDIDRLKVHFENESHFTVEDVKILNKILIEFSNLETELRSAITMTREQEKQAQVVLYEDVLAKITDAQVFLNDVFDRHRSKLGEFEAVSNTSSNTPFSPDALTKLMVSLTKK